MDRTYIAIDLKSFYASVECADRKLDPLKTNLVVADPTRTEKTICLAVSPSLKAYGIPGRPRLFEVLSKVKEINEQRLRRTKGGFVSKSFDSDALKRDSSLELSFIIAPPRMLLYEKISAKIFSIYMKYVSSEDIHVYSIDECFMDVTAYLNTYKMSARELAITMIRDVLYTTGITATAGIGTNLYLAKIAMDIVAKHVPADKDGVRIAQLDELSYRHTLWAHTPLTDFWRVGRGIAARMAGIGCLTMGDIARQSLRDEELLYKIMGKNAELLIDHAWGREPVLMSHIKSYRPSSKSLSAGQVLKEPYGKDRCRLIVKEMTELLAMDLVRKNLLTNQVVLTLGSNSGYLHSSCNLDDWTSSSNKLIAAMMSIFERLMGPEDLVRRVGVAACNVILRSQLKDIPKQLDLFADYEEKNRLDEKERKVQEASLSIREKFGKNAILKGMNLEKGGTTIERNMQIGGHRAGD